jgi:hypothetical protein
LYDFQVAGEQPGQAMLFYQFRTQLKKQGIAGRSDRPGRVQGALEEPGCLGRIGRHNRGAAWTLHMMP